MRYLLLALLLASPATAADLTSIDDCTTQLAQDPAATREAAARWRALGGGTPARICEAFAIEALGARQTAAERLTEIAQDPGATLDAPARAALLDRATLLWQDLAQPRLANLAAAAAARVAPTAHRQQTIAETFAALGSWKDVLDTLPPDRAPALRARALIETGQLEAAQTLLDTATPAPALTLETARLAAARGDRDGALATLAALRTEDPALMAARRTLLQTLATARATEASAIPAPPRRQTTTPRPMPRRP